MSLVLAIVGLLVISTSAGRPPVLAIPLTLLALILGITGWFSIRRQRTALRGTGYAFLGGVLGVVGGFFAMVFTLVAIVRPFQQGHFQTRGNQRWDFDIPRSNPVLDGSITNFTSNLPIIVLHTLGQSIDGEDDTVVQAQFFDTRGQRASHLAQPDHQGLVGIHPRGHTSLHLPKQSYSMHTLDLQTNQTKVALLGLPQEEDWVLYASFEDKTMIRDVLAYELTRRMGHYAPRTRYVELFIRDSERPLSMRHYRGVYVLVEKIKRGPDRVNIAKLEPEHRSEPEISGGYIVKRDHQDDSGGRFSTRQGGPYFYVYPGDRKITREQRSWIASYFRSFEAALYGSDFADPEKGYAAYLDVDAFIDAHWLIEMTKNVDGFRYSAFITKDRGGRLRPGPPWDWNRSMGNANYYDGWETEGWYSRRLRPNEISWFRRLREDPAFSERCDARWRELRRTVFDPAKIHELIDQLAAELQESQERNFKRWPILGRHVTCNYFVGDTYEEEVRWLKDWIGDRIAWIDRQVDKN